MTSDQSELDLWKQRAEVCGVNAMNIAYSLVNDKAWHATTKEMLKKERLAHLATTKKLQDPAEPQSGDSILTIENEKQANQAHQEGYDLGREHERREALQKVREAVDHATDKRWPMKALDWFWNAYAPVDKDDYDKNNPTTVGS